MTGDRLSAVTITKRYGLSPVLDHVTFTLAPGEVHGLVGHNGAGKSTLIKILAGAERPDGGQILLDGAPVTFANPREAADAGIVCVFQELSLLPNLTVRQNLFLAREVARAGVLDRTAMRSMTRRLLAEYGLKLTGDEKVADLPVAQRQMVEIIGALSRNARVILLDEPTTALETSQIEHLLGILRRIAREQGVAVVVVDHKLDEIFAVCDRVTALMDGRVVLSATVDTVSREALVESIVGAGEARHVPAVVAPVARVPGPRPGRSDGPILEVRSIGAPRGLRDVSFSLAPGEVLGLYGLAGSGRSRLLRTLYGLEPVAWGEMRFRGAAYRPHTPADAMRAGIAFVSEERKANGFIPEFDAVRNCTLPILHRYSWLGIIRQRQAARDATAMLKRLHIRGDLQLPLARLSGGNQQKALLAKAVLQQPALLLLDEPTKGIDVGTKAEIHHFIKSLAEQSGLGVLVVSTEEEEVLSVASEIIIMHNGVCSGERVRSADLSDTDLRRLALGTAVRTEALLA